MMRRQWLPLRICNMQTELNELISENEVSRFRSESSTNGNKYTYRCASYKKFPSCDIRLQAIQKSNEDESCRVLRSSEHNHTERALTTRPPSPVREDVITYVAAGISETQIRRAVSITHSGTTRQQVKSLVKYYRTKERPSAFSLQDLRGWCMLHSALPLPTDLDSLFVPYFKLNIDELFIFMTTRRLLSASSKSTYLQVDGTYKLNWNDFPLLICGTSDSQLHFHPCGIALVNSDEAATYYIELFKALKWSVPLVTHQAYVVNYVMCDGSKDWSEKLTVAGFSQNVVISKELGTLALKWSQDVIKYATPIPWNIFETVVPTSHPIMSIQEWINCFGINAFSSFNHFKIWFFCKEYVCKHTVGLAIAFGYHVISKDRMPLGPKTRGRPKKSSLALVF
ncbi:unnamed protein product [Didymodactylos carnosus]|uniref:MULE transposase domain-containing protein n=1 Tax=Didymodactylos carnosus TaxID=1234261 RepID=A0A8S2F7T4_9BILA|nr:unnamed protein product [Didymodactylos carnosus]CAF4166518.1 unnamed protein product [Didymodactylos carnosus]